MTDFGTFACAVILLLATPGPTNTLLAASGAAIGLRRSLRLIPAEVAGYLLSVSLLLTIAGPQMAAFPILGVSVKLAACLYLMRAAVALWRDSHASLTEEQSIAPPGRVLATTLLNPKGFFFAFTIFPSAPTSELGPWLKLFAILIAFVGFGWILLGALIARSVGQTITTPRISRASAVVLALFATMLARSAFAAGSS
ncbi:MULTISPECIES: LysE family translocator [unclassified Bradyrhizobium]|uniref:LysE family translocator n=1 Tax=unclassified Bradyrhizobium TaxID=2631580 RepID=UPI0029160322|nr:MULTISPECIES: LysE family transporter [unclassified Bradyrhizobium]